MKGTGQNEDLSVDLRTITSSNGGDMTVNFRILTEIATCQLFNDNSDTKNRH